MPTYKTPDVYVEEISLFPPSVAEVETSIPAFIGYTAQATNITDGDLLSVPTRVKSLLEYETYFGGAPEITLTDVTLDDNNQFVSATFSSGYYMYDSLRAFFDNGGGPCYIVSVGTYTYPAAIDRDELKGGLDAIKKFDEPTILLFPDATALSASQLGAVQQHALQQCADLKDRVAILDTRLDDVDTDGSGGEPGKDFRNNIGINNLKYGAAYAPWLKVNYDKNVSYEDISTGTVLKKGGNPVSLSTLTTDTGIQTAITNLENALDDVALVNTKLDTLLTTDASINAEYNTLMRAYLNSKTETNLQNLYGFVFKVATFVDDLAAGAVGTEFADLVESSITNTLKAAFTTLISHDKQLALPATALTPAYVAQWDSGTDPSNAAWGTIFTVGATVPASALVISGSDEAKMDVFIPYLNSNFAIINGQAEALIAAADAYLSTYEQTLYDIFPTYKNIIKGINDSLAPIPPSGAVAGIYALVDNQRGVWKAPANVSLSNVVGPTYNYDADETDNLNVDVNAGKSINAIRAFAGKGTLVWGARTLAGNDNEWRYISVRRFFNMVEESIKKSTYWAVFEPNDANTWVKVRGMIENYLTQKWREGALAGATIKEAFFVKCGLGTTMTSQDILEGRMVVEIGMAVVRPAEFIILKFSHKLQTS